MVCNLCELFEGNQGEPCDACRTTSRIVWILRTQRLHISQEGEALSALRNCAGALTDLLEKAGRLKAADPGAPAPEADTGVTLDAGVSAPEGAEEAVKEEKEAKPRAKKEKRKDKKAKKEKKSSESQEDTGLGSSKDKKRRPSETGLIEVKEEEEDKEDRARSAPESRERKRKERARSSREAEVSTGERPRGSSINEEIRARPEEFGLHHGPTEPRRSRDGGNTRAERDEENEPRPRVPTPPSYPPPDRRDEIPRRRGYNDRRSRDSGGRGRPKKNKGWKHFQRGQDWKRSRGRGRGSR